MKVDHVNSVFSFRSINFKNIPHIKKHVAVQILRHIFVSSPESLMARGKLEFTVSTLATSTNSVTVTLLKTSDHQGTE